MSEYLAERTLANMRFGLSITRPGSQAKTMGLDTYEIETANVDLKNLLIKFEGQQEGDSRGSCVHRN